VLTQPDAAYLNLVIYIRTSSSALDWPLEEEVRLLETSALAPGSTAEPTEGSYLQIIRPRENSVPLGPFEAASGPRSMQKYPDSE
jgi:hypothetical protein